MSLEWDGIFVEMVEILRWSLERDGLFVILVEILRQALKRDGIFVETFEILRLSKEEHSTSVSKVTGGLFVVVVSKYI